MRKISKVTMQVLESDPRMKLCALAPHIPHECSKKIDWHHNLIYAGRQSDIPETILGICTEIHDQANNKQVKEILDWVMLNQMTVRQFSELPRAYLGQKKALLNKRYGAL